jgi:2-polyprenyl-3-methyl-5-hydroxy-6-metoxy-1,4-benzoquinol methylase
MITCERCGLVRVEGVPDGDRLNQLYSESYFRSSDSSALGYDDYIADRAKISKTFGKRIEEIERLVGRKGRMLDVGCATGFSVEVARSRGWEAQGVELSRFACDYARREIGVDVFCGSLGEVELEPESLDVVTMWDYIEHSPDPLGELRQANRLLKSGGLLALTTPNIASLPARIWGSRWMGIKQEEHLYYFAPETIKKMLELCGFEPERLRHVGKYIDADFFIKRAGLYSETIRRLLERLTQILGMSDSVLYVNPYDIMIVYGKKVGETE